MEPVWTDLTKWRTSAGTKTPTLSTVVSLPPVSYLQDPWWDPWHETVNETLYDQHGTAAPAGRCRAHGLFQTTNQMIILSSLGPPSNRQDPSAQFLLGFPQQALPCDIRWIHFLQALQILHRSLGRSFQHVKHHEHHELCWIIVRTSINKSWILTHPYHDSPYVTIPYVIMVNMKRSIIISYGSYQYSYQYSYQLKFPFIHGRVLPVLIIFCKFLGFSHEITPHDFGTSRNSPSKAQLPRAWCSFSASSAFARRKSALGCSGSCQRLGIDLAPAMGVKNGLRLVKVRIHIFFKKHCLSHLFSKTRHLQHTTDRIYVYI